MNLHLPFRESVCSSITPPSSPFFHLHELQEDIVKLFIAGKPFIKDMLRNQFRFKETSPDLHKEW